MRANSENYRQKNMQKSKGGKRPGASGKLSQRRAKRAKRRRITNIIIIILICIAVFAIGGKKLYNYFLDTAKILQPSKSDTTVDWESEIAKNFDKDIINFALMGFDRNENRDSKYSSFRPDTIMIISVNFRTNDTSIVSIPRDTYVKIYDLDFHDKINHSYVHGYQRRDVVTRHESGMRTAIRTIQDFLGGVPIHYFIAMDLDAVVQIIDTVGGIYYNVEHQVRNYGGRGRVVIEPGYQLLNGYQYMHYVRFRYVGSDFARIERQQNILVETFDQIRKNGKLSQIPKLIKSLAANIETNLSVSQMSALALYGLEVETEGIGNYMFEGSDQYKPQNGLNIYYMVPNEQKRVELIKKVFGVDVPLRQQIILPGKMVTPAPVSEEPPDETPEPELEPEPVTEPEPEPELQPDPETPEPEPQPDSGNTGDDSDTMPPASGDNNPPAIGEG